MLIRALAFTRSTVFCTLCLCVYLPIEGFAAKSEPQSRSQSQSQSQSQPGFWSMVINVSDMMENHKRGQWLPNPPLNPHRFREDMKLPKRTKAEMDKLTVR